VVIPVRNDCQRLDETIDSIINNRSTDFDLEIVVVDDASTNEYHPKLSHITPNVTVKVFPLKERVGVPRARNHGSQLATGRILFMTDAHVSFSQDWDRYIEKNLQSNRILAATIADTSSDFRGYGCRLVVPFMGTKWYRHLDDSISNGVQVASSAGTVLEKQLFQRIGGYDSGMIIYGAAEPEFSVRAWLSDAEIIAVPELVVNHIYKSKTETNNFIAWARPFMIHNSLRFGSLYLSELAILQMIRLYTISFYDNIQQAFNLLLDGDVWQRRAYLENTLSHNFDWFIDRFNLTDQTGQKIL
jgi:glycosyltransferase involved in cell wall biosynthesis